MIRYRTFAEVGTALILAALWAILLLVVESRL